MTKNKRSLIWFRCSNSFSSTLPIISWSSHYGGRLICSSIRSIRKLFDSEKGAPVRCSPRYFGRNTRRNSPHSPSTSLYLPARYFSFLPHSVCQWWVSKSTLRTKFSKLQIKYLISEPFQELSNLGLVIILAENEKTLLPWAFLDGLLSEIFVCPHKLFVPFLVIHMYDSFDLPNVGDFLSPF